MKGNLVEKEDFTFNKRNKLISYFQTSIYCYLSDYIKLVLKPLLPHKNKAVGSNAYHGSWPQVKLLLIIDIVWLSNLLVGERVIKHWHYDRIKHQMKHLYCEGI